MSSAPLSVLDPFDHQPLCTRLVFGAGTFERLGVLTRELPARRVLLVTDPGLVAVGHPARACTLLEAAGLEVVMFDRAAENPTTRCVDECVRAARSARVDALVALGGGSSIDTAKGCNFILTNGGQMRDYWGVGKATHPMLPLLAVPTTAGTGSECQSAALIADAETHQKMACLDRKAAPRIALLDPQLTLSQPPRVTACTGLDALAHAVEASVTRARTPASGLYAREAFALGFPALLRVLSDPADLAARGRMQLAAAWAGLAVEHSMLGAAHAAANPLTARAGLIHGHAVALMLPHVVRFNSHDAQAQHTYAALAAVLEPEPIRVDLSHTAKILATRLDGALASASLPRALADCGVARSQLPALAQEAAQQWTARFNPRPIAAEDFLRLYEAAFDPRPAPAPA